MTQAKAAGAESLFKQLADSLKSRGAEFVKSIKGVIVFRIGGSEWTLDLREGDGSLEAGLPGDDVTADLELTAKESDFVKLVMGKMSPQTAFMTGKLSLSGSMSLALRLQPILQAAAPRSKL
eukprot:evm.model.scf_456.3 EVM.evm.TU.scf_456.3   scf_456:10210-12094(+)